MEARRNGGERQQWSCGDKGVPEWSLGTREAGEGFTRRRGDRNGTEGEVSRKDAKNAKGKG